MTRRLRFPAPKTPSRRGRRPVLEPLEPRLAPAIFNVNSTADILAPPPGVVTLRSAIEAANATPGTNTINLTVPGTYKITLAGAGEDNNATGDFDIIPNPANPPGSALFIVNTSGGAVAVDGNGLDRVFDINPAALTGSSPVLQVQMQGFTIQNGIASDALNPDGPNGSGGGVRDQGNAFLYLDTMLIAGNRATADGGGVAMENTAVVASQLTVTNSTFSGNRAGDSGGGIDTDAIVRLFIVTSAIDGNTAAVNGGGIWLDAIGTVGTSMTMTDVQLSHNSALAGVGGAVGNAGDGTVGLTNCTIGGNFAGSNGGAYGDLNGLGTVYVQGCYLSNNTAVGDGGGVYGSGPLTQVTRSEIDANTAGGSGGGIFAGGTTLTVYACTVAGNTSGLAGGGIEDAASGTGTAGSIIANTTVADNSVLNTQLPPSGGGINVSSVFAGDLSLLDDTINGNFASAFGGGIFYEGTSGSVTVTNTIIAKNAVGAGGSGPDAANAAGNFTDGGGNLIGIAGAGSGNTGFNAPTTQTGTVANPLDPILGPLANNGGVSAGSTGQRIVLQTELPQLHSPAIAKGVVAVAEPADERGFPSVVNGHVNVGAVAQDPFIAAAMGGGGSRVNIYDAVTGRLWGSFAAFGPAFTGGGTVAVGDVNGDGISDFIIGKGPGQQPIVKVVDGTQIDQEDANGEILESALLGRFDAYDPAFAGGVNVAYGIGNDNVPEIVTGAGPGGAPHVLVIDGTKINQVQPDGQIAPSAVLGGFYAYSPQFSGGVNVAAGDVNGDGVIDVITGAGPGGGPHVKVVDGRFLNERVKGGEIAPGALLASFFAYDPTFSGGVSVAYGVTAGGLVEVVTGAGAGGGPHVKVINGDDLNDLLPNAEIAPAALYASFFAYDPSFTGGVRVATLPDEPVRLVVDVLLAPGPGTPQTVKVVDGAKTHDLQPNGEIADSALLDNFYAFGPDFDQGVFVGGR